MTSKTKGILNNTFSQGNVPLPHIGPMNMAQFDVNLLTPWAKPWTSSDINLENKAIETSKRIGILAKSRTVPMENDHKFVRSPGKKWISS